MPLDEAFRDLFAPEAVAVFVSLLPDGSPHAVPLWVDYDGEHVLSSAAADARRRRNVERDPRVAVTAIDPANPYRSAMVRGEVVEITGDGLAFNDRMARAYWGVEEFPVREPEFVLLKTRPDEVIDTSSFTPEAYDPAE